jgi:serine/threonine-protein kinase RsbW
MNELLFQGIAHLEDLEEIRNRVEVAARLLGLHPERNYDLLLAVTELVTNSIEHGYKGNPGFIEIKIERAGDDVSVILCDQAPPFDPRQAPPPDLTLPLEQRSYGGLGIFLTLESVDDFVYEPLAGGGNQIRIVFRSPLG